MGSGNAVLRHPADPMVNERGPTMRQALRMATLALLAGCGHSDAFVTPTTPPLGPFNSGPDVRLTLNSDQDYWPIWTQDGRGILYSFVDPGANVVHRCVGLLPAGGGQRLWQLCDDRATQGDTASMFSGYALDSTGRLLYAEAAGSAKALNALPTVTLWLADTAAPFARTALLTLPVSGASAITWLADIRWTGTNTFIALGQMFGTAGHCTGTDAIFCPQQDSVFFGAGGVMSGTIAAGRATLQAISGTDGATDYSLAEGGASIVFTRVDDLHLWKVPVSGGVAVAVASVAQGGAAEILGVSCQAATCVVASAPVSVVVPGSVSPQFHAGNSRLDAVSLTTGTSQTLLSNVGQVYSSPQLSPAGGNVVSGVGGTWWGHLQTFYGGGNADLHLYPTLVH
jgi:hypothetical protein